MGMAVEVQCRPMAVEAVLVASLERRMVSVVVVDWVTVVELEG